MSTLSAMRDLTQQAHRVREGFREYLLSDTLFRLGTLPFRVWRLKRQLKHLITKLRRHNDKMERDTIPALMAALRESKDLTDLQDDIWGYMDERDCLDGDFPDEFQVLFPALAGQLSNERHRLQCGKAVLSKLFPPPSQVAIDQSFDAYRTGDLMELEKFIDGIRGV